MTTTAAEKVFARGVRVKAGSERYCDTSYTATHQKWGEQVRNPFDDGRPVEEPSQKDKAFVGAYVKMLANKAGLIALDDHTKELIGELTERHIWSGDCNGTYGHFVGAKALLDDATSGGFSITPNVFDNAIVVRPLLTGEILPFVTVKDIPRGRVVDGAYLGTPTLTWAVQEGAAADLFDTADLVAQIATSVQTVSCFLEVGLDFLGDSAVDIGGEIEKRLGDRLSAELDRVILSGLGTIEPDGIFNATGVSSITCENGNAGPYVLADPVSMMFSVSKAYRQGGKCYFVSNDTTYARMRQIAIDAGTPSTDQRPALAPLTDISSYQTLGWRHAIQNDLSNTVCGFGRLDAYRLYRRLGASVTIETAGSTLKRSNKALICFRGRYGGQLMDGAAFSKWGNGML
jgi:HK97 family phage major capsid protein